MQCIQKIETITWKPDDALLKRLGVVSFLFAPNIRPTSCRSRVVVVVLVVGINFLHKRLYGKIPGLMLQSVYSRIISQSSLELGLHQRIQIMLVTGMTL